jgi:DNA-binding XRE family transcriptional regulator
MDERELGLIAEAHLMLRSGRARSLRRELDMTVGDMGAACGVTGPCISQWEAGRRTPRGQNAVRYARALKALAKVADAAERASDPPHRVSGATAEVTTDQRSDGGLV